MSCSGPQPPVQHLQGFGGWKEAGDTEVHGRNSDEPEVAGAPPSSIWKALDMPLSAVAGVPRRQYHSRVQAAIFQMPMIGRIRRAQFRHQQYYGDYQSYDKNPNRMEGHHQMRMSRRKVQGGLDVEARSWLG